MSSDGVRVFVAICVCTVLEITVHREYYSVGVRVGAEKPRVRRVFAMKQSLFISRVCRPACEGRRAEQNFHCQAASATRHSLINWRYFHKTSSPDYRLLAIPHSPFLYLFSPYLAPILLVPFSSFSTTRSERHTQGFLFLFTAHCFGWSTVILRRYREAIEERIFTSHWIKSPDHFAFPKASSPI